VNAEPETRPAAGEDAVHSAARGVARGIVALLASRFVTIPLSILVNAILARRLGASDFGAIYLANMGLGVAFLFVDFGTMPQAISMVARDHSSASRVLGAGIALRLALGLLLLAALPQLTRFLGYSDTVRMVFFLTAIRSLVGSGAAMAGAVVQGFERISLHARLTVVTTILDGAIVIPVLLLGGGLHAALVSQIAGSMLALAVWFVALQRIGAARIAFAFADVLQLARGGVGFVVFDLAIRFQPYLDADFLEKLASRQAVGWYAAANRIQGALLLPVLTLNFAIYPSMARLWSSDPQSYARLTRVGLRAVLLFGMVAAVGAVLFAEPAVAIIYGKDAYGPAAQNLQVLSVYIVLLYLSMVLGCAILATGRQLLWAGVQALCIPLTLVIDPLLIPWFQERFGNGGLGVCANLAAEEVLMVCGGLLLVPRIVLSRSLLADAARSLASGVAMAACGLLLRPLPALAIPASAAVYFGAQALLGGFDAEMLEQIRGIFRRKLRAQEAPPPGAPTA
jgi:O-antigen/teichoic acid export membrane protein